MNKGNRAPSLYYAFEWLVSVGMLNRVYNVTRMEHPLSAFDRLDCFKLFVFDMGLLKNMAGIDNSAILLKADYQFKGPLTENLYPAATPGAVRCRTTLFRNRKR